MTNLIAIGGGYLFFWKTSHKEGLSDAKMTDCDALELSSPLRRRDYPDAPFFSQGYSFMFI